MAALPRRVASTFSRLKKESDKYVEIKRIKGYYFVYQSTSRWDKEKKKPVKVPLYIGRIANSGEFIQAKKKKPRPIEQPQVQAEHQLNDPNQITLESVTKETKPYKHEMTILTALSMNGRMPISVLGKMVGLKETATASQVRKLERKYGIKYITEIDVTKFGYVKFLVTVKFLDTEPKIEYLKKLFIEDPRIQLVLMTKGDFNLVIYFLAKSNEVALFIAKLRERIPHRSIWISTPIDETYGFIPMREEFLDLLKDKMLTREYSLLKEILNNGKIDFSEIDRKHGFDAGRSQYSYYKLREQNIIKRVTISLESLPIKYVGIIVGTVVDRNRFMENRKEILLDIIKETKNSINAYILADDIISPDGAIVYMPVFKNGDLESTIDILSDQKYGIRAKALLVSSILLGNFCYRRFDNAYSIQTEVLIKQYGLKPPTKINYNETGRKRMEKRVYISDVRKI